MLVPPSHAEPSSPAPERRGARCPARTELGELVRRGTERWLYLFATDALALDLQLAANYCRGSQETDLLVGVTTDLEGNPSVRGSGRATTDLTRMELSLGVVTTSWRGRYAASDRSKSCCTL